MFLQIPGSILNVGHRVLSLQGLLQTDTAGQLGFGSLQEQYLKSLPLLPRRRLFWISWRADILCTCCFYGEFKNFQPYPYLCNPWSQRYLILSYTSSVRIVICLLGRYHKSVFVIQACVVPGLHYLQAKGGLDLMSARQRLLVLIQPGRNNR